MHQDQIDDRTRRFARNNVSQLSGVQIIDYMSRKQIRPRTDNPQYQELYPIIKRELSQLSYYIDNFGCRQCASLYRSLIECLPETERKDELTILEYLEEG